MKKEVERIKSVINKDKLFDSQKLTKLISREVQDRLEKFMKIENCSSQISVGQTGGYDILILVKAKNILL